MCHRLHNCANKARRLARVIGELRRFQRGPLSGEGNLSKLAGAREQLAVRLDSDPPWKPDNYEEMEREYGDWQAATLDGRSS